MKQLLAGLLMWPTAVFSAAFSSGEKLTYDVRWFFITAGKASLEIASPSNFIAQAKSDLVFFYKVNDRVESVVSEGDLLPIKFEKHLREGNFKKDQIILFDRTNNTARYGDENLPVGPGCRDPLAAVYYLRGLNFPEVGGNLTVWVHVDKKNYPIMVRILKKETVKVPAGKFSAVQIKLEPQPGFEGLFRQKGDMWIWLTDDERKIPVKIKVEVPIIGSINIDLKSTN